MDRLDGTAKSFWLSKKHVCKKHMKDVTYVSKDLYHCPECGIVRWKNCQRLWIGVLVVDIIDIHVRAWFPDVETYTLQVLLSKIGISWQMTMDELKPLRGDAWNRKCMEVKTRIENKVNQHLIGKTIPLRGKMNTKTSRFLVMKIGNIAEPDASQEGTRFVRGNREELKEITDKVLSEYEKHRGWDENNPNMTFVKHSGGFKVEIILKAPTQYGQAYRVRMRVNDVHMYPAKYVLVGRDRQGNERIAWVFRAYHREKWKEKLEAILEHCVKFENQAITALRAAQDIGIDQVEQALAGLSPEIIERIKENWRGGTLWDLVTIASQIDRAAGIFILKKYKFFPEDEAEP